MEAKPLLTVDAAPDAVAVVLERELIRELPNGVREMVAPAGVPIPIEDARRLGIQVNRRAAPAAPAGPSAPDTAVTPTPATSPAGAPTPNAAELLPTPGPDALVQPDRQALEPEPVREATPRGRRARGGSEE